MREYAEDLNFKGIDSTNESSTLIDSTLALVNDSDLPDKEVREKVTGFLENAVIDFHSDDPDVPRELPALYENSERGYNCSIYAPRDGEIRKVNLNAQSKVDYTGRNNSWETFNLNDTSYSVMVGQ